MGLRDGARTSFNGVDGQTLSPRQGTATFRFVIYPTDPITRNDPIRIDIEFIYSDSGTLDGALISSIRLGGD